MYKLSVIVPVYNCEKYLSDCLASLAEQTVFDVMQVVLVNDGSVDESPNICNGFAVVNKNCTVIHKENGGVSSARNAGLDAASGEFIGFVDADDTVAPDYYENLLRAAEKSGCDMAFGGLTFFRADALREQPAFIEAGKVISKENLADEFARKMLSMGSQNAVWNKIMRRSIIEDDKIRFPVGIKIAEDKLFVLEFLRHSKSIICAGGCGYFYRDVQTSAMHSNSKMSLLLAVNEREAQAFVSLGLDEKTVLEEKAVFLFTELADYLQREYVCGKSFAKKAAKEHFANTGLMSAIHPGLPTVKANLGTIYRLLAIAFEKRSCFLTLLVLFIQKKINERGDKK